MSFLAAGGISSSVLKWESEGAPQYSNTIYPSTTSGLAAEMGATTACRSLVSSLPLFPLFQGQDGELTEDRWGYQPSLFWVFMALISAIAL